MLSHDLNRLRESFLIRYVLMLGETLNCSPSWSNSFNNVDKFGFDFPDSILATDE